MFISRDLYGHPIVLHTHKHTFVVFSLKRKELVAAAAVEKNHFSCWRWGDCSWKKKQKKSATREHVQTSLRVSPKSKEWQLKERKRN